MINRKSWHYPGEEPEVDDTDDETEPDMRRRPISVYQTPNRGRLPSPALSDAGGNQPTTNAAPGALLSPREPSPASNLTVVADAQTASPTIQQPSTISDQVSRRGNNNVKRSGKTPRPRRQMQRKKKSNNKDWDADKENRKPKTTKEAILPSRRSSRRNAASRLWFLDDSGKACLVSR
ncbi:hypothetical protein ACQKWADRAFT_300969 [Trichoderma austrokoningii]